jgi:hypothetical protein
MEERRYKDNTRLDIIMSDLVQIRTQIAISWSNSYCYKSFDEIIFWR